MMSRGEQLLRGESNLRLRTGLTPLFVRYSHSSVWYGGLYLTKQYKRARLLARSPIQ